MVDRLINKTDTPTDPYRVKSATETRKDKQREQQTPEEKAEQFEKARKKGGKWQKYGAQTITIKPIRVPRAQIKVLHFRHAVWNKGASMLIVDIKWANGRLTEGAVVRLKGMEDYMRARKLPTGAMVPEDMWAADEVEFGIPVVTSQSGLHQMDELEKEISAPGGEVSKRPSFLTDSRNRIRWDLVVGIVAALTILGLIILYALR